MKFCSIYLGKNSIYTKYEALPLKVKIQEIVSIEIGIKQKIL